MSALKFFEINCETSERCVEDFLKHMLKEVMAVVQAESGSLFLFDDEHKELVLDAFYNSKNLDIKGLKKSMGEGISGQVINIKTPVLVKDIDSDRRFNRNGFNHYSTKSFMSIPIVSLGRVIGLINLADKKTGELFMESDLEAAVVIIKYGCMALENYKNYLRLKLEREAQEKQKLHLEKYASVGKLAAGVVHEVNNPLDGVIRYTNILLEQMQDNSIAREYLVEINKGLNRIANITKSLLTFSHQVNSGLPQAKKYADIHKLIDESLDILRHNLGDSIIINRRYREGLPRILDYGLQHVFMNLIKNALDAMPSGGVLEITTEWKDLAVSIIFKDTGSGVPLELQEKIFEPFFTTKSMDKGTGLGLSICKEILNKYKGSIELASHPNSGSSFTISVPGKYLENA